MPSNLTRIKNNQVTDSTIIASAKLVSQSVTGGLLSDPLTYSGNITINGNLTVQGTTTTVDTTNTLVADPIIVLSRGETSTPSNDSGFLVERGTSDNAAFLWDETNDRFEAITTTADGLTGGSITAATFADVKVGNVIATVGSTFGNIKISGNTVESVDTNGNVNITPNGTGDINLSADTVVVGDSNTQAVVTTNGTGNLFLNTNNGTNSGNIQIAQGANGNITITANGTGEVVTNTLAISDLTSGRFVIAGTNGTVTDSSAFSYSGSDVTLSGDIAVNGGDITTTATTANLWNANVTTLNLGGVATTLEIGAATGTTNINNNLDVDGNINLDGANFTTTAATVNLANANTTTVNFAGSATTLEIGAATGTTNVNNNLDVDGNINLDGANFTTTAATVNLVNANTTTLNLGGAATAVNIGAATGTTIIKNDLQVDGADLTFGSATTANVANATVTTLNIGGAATTVEIGAATGTTNVNNNLDVDGNINLDGASLTTTAATVNIANANSTTVNFAGAATTLEIGAATGTTNVNNNLDVDGNINLDGASLTTTAATVNIANANSTTLNIGGAATTLALGSSSGNVIVGGDFQINGNDIRASTGNVAITMNDIDVTIVGNLTIQGQTTNIGTQDLVVEDSIINLHTHPNLAPLTVDDGRDIGMKFHYYKVSDKHAFVGWANDTGYLEYYSDATETAGTITGTYGTIKAATFNSNVSTGTAPFTVVSTTQVANLNVAASGTSVTVTAASQPNITSVGNLTIANIDNIQINDNTISSTDTNGNIILAPNGTGDVQLDADTVRIGDSGSAATLTTNGTGNLNLSTNEGTNSGTIVIVNGANGNINLTPNGTGDINLSADTVVFGDSNTEAVVTTNGTGNLLLNTNSGTNSGNIQIAQGANGNITITANGTGEVVANTLAVSDLTSTRVIYAGSSGALVDSANLTFSGTLLTITGNANVTNTANIGNIQISTNTISSIDSNGNVNIQPNGTGDINLSADTVVVGDSNTQAVVTTNGTGNLFLSTNSGTNSGNIQLAQGANGNITITANGTGEVVTNTLAVSDLTSTRVVYAGSNGTLVDNTNLTFSGTQLTITGSANVSSTANIGNIRITGNTVSSIDTNGNINLDANGTGDVVINSSGDNSDFYAYANTNAYASALIYGKSSSGQVGILTESPTAGATLHINALDSMIVPKGATGDRPGTGVAGMLRFNTGTSYLEFYNGSAWTSTQGAFTVIAADSFSGDGSTVNFTLGASATSASVIVSINGIVQIPGTAYSVTTTTLTFTEAPASGDAIDVRRLTTSQSISEIADLNTSVIVNDTANVANVKIDGTLIFQVANTAILPGGDNLYNIGSGSYRWKNVYATNTSIQNADLAENYLADKLLAPGTVVSFGGVAEITESNEDMDTRVAGVVSTCPAHLMNSALEGNNVLPIALQGRVPTKVKGIVKKGDMMVSAGDGSARAESNPKIGSVIGKALSDSDDTEGIIEIVVGRL